MRQRQPTLFQFAPQAFRRSMRKRIVLPPRALRDQMVAAALVAAERIVLKKYFGAPSNTDDIASEVAFAALPRIYKWRPGGNKSLAQYAFGCCGYALIDLMRERQAAPSEDALDHASTGQEQFHTDWFSRQIDEREEPQFTDEDEE